MYSVLETEGERIKYLYEMHTNLNKSIVSVIIVVFFRLVTIKYIWILLFRF